MNEPTDYESGGESACCGWEIKNGFCSCCHEHAEPIIEDKIEDKKMSVEGLQFHEWVEENLEKLQSDYRNYCDIWDSEPAETSGKLVKLEFDKYCEKKYEDEQEAWEAKSEAQMDDVISG